MSEKTFQQFCKSSGKFRSVCWVLRSFSWRNFGKDLFFLCQNSRRTRTESADRTRWISDEKISRWIFETRRAKRKELFGSANFQEKDFLYFVIRWKNVVRRCSIWDFRPKKANVAKNHRVLTGFFCLERRNAAAKLKKRFVSLRKSFFVKTNRKRVRYRRAVSSVF